MIGSGPEAAGQPTIYLVEDELLARDEMTRSLEDAGWAVETFDSCEHFLKAYKRRPDSCLVLDVHFSGMSGLELLERLAGTRDAPPVVMMSGTSDLAEAVQSMKQGAVDFVKKPFVGEKLVSSVRNALKRSTGRRKALEQREEGSLQRADLTPREREVLERVLSGHPSKNIAADLGISQRTVESHRTSIMQKTHAGSLPALARMMMCEACPLLPEGRV